MSYVLMLLIACALAYFFPHYKLTAVNKVLSQLLDTLISRISNTDADSEISRKITSLLFVVFLFFFSAVIPGILFLWLSEFSLIITFVIELFCAYMLISVQKIPVDFFNSTKRDNISNNIIQSIIHFIDYFFIPILCICILGIPFAFFYRAFSYCTKKTALYKNLHFYYVHAITNIVYMLPIMAISITMFASSLFLPFCNTAKALEVFSTDKKNICPLWLSYILSVILGMLRTGLSLTFIDDEGNYQTKTIGNIENPVTQDTMKQIAYLLYTASALLLGFSLLFRLSLLWGLW